MLLNESKGAGCVKFHYHYLFQEVFMNRWAMGKGEYYTKKSHSIMRGRVIGNSLEIC